VFSDLLIEAYRESPFGMFHSSDNNMRVESTSSTEKNATRKPEWTVNSHKLVVSSHSRYLMKMLTSGLREGGENTIRLTTAYPGSLRKLLLSFYEHVIEIESAEELIEMLYLADEYDVPTVMTALKQVFSANSTTSNNNASNALTSTLQSNTQLKFTLDNAHLFLTCSSKLNLNLEPKVFSGLMKEWWRFGPMEDIEIGYEERKRICIVLLQSLNFTEY
jgi:hypothetical protein